MIKKYGCAFGRLLLIGLTVGSTSFAFGVVKPHAIAFGKWTSVQVPGGSEEGKLVPLKVRALLVDARVKEFTVGAAHDITDRLFVVRRAFRINDSLAQESASTPRWQWERGGWLLVDRVSGKVSAVNLPEFDGDFSNVTWYRDYAAYCGISEDGKRVDAIVAQVNRRKPVLKQKIEGKRPAETNLVFDFPGSVCHVPIWDRMPARVTFEVPGAFKETIVLRGHVVDLISEEEDNEEAAK